LNYAPARRLGIDHILELVHRKIDVSCNVSGSTCAIQHVDGGQKKLQSLSIELRAGRTVIAFHVAFRVLLKPRRNV